MFNIDQKESFAKKEQRVLEFWKTQKIFQKSVQQRKQAPLFSTYDGPPFATGLPHYGHLLAGTIKDTVLRYKTMEGFHVPRRFGWDCHGLPVENEIEKAKELSGGPEIEAFGIAKFNEECRSIVFRYAEEWQDTVDRTGRWVDFSDNFLTMDKDYMESVWWVFGQLFGKGLVYEGFKVMPFSAKLGTPLSNFEANLNYKDVDDPSLTVKLALTSEPKTYLLVWTTTPWTLPSNLAVAVGPEIDYVKVAYEGETYILAKERLSSHFKEDSSFEIIEEMKGKKLAGLKYEPLFSYFADDKQEKAFTVLCDDFVSTEDGTGIVHMAPAFGEVDFFACQKAEIELVCPIDHNGKFTDQVTDFAGLFVKDADKEIIKWLKARGKVFRHTQIRHRYPFCWRSDTPLIYKAVHTWFVSVEKIKKELLENNDQIHWVPDHIKGGRFGKWLENARDWAVSRNRYWGTPIPIWRSSDGEVIAISSLAELEERVGKKISDLHRHHIDELTFVENGKTFKRIPEVFDCWFESGSVPLAQNHYPFENKEKTLEAFPADFIAEGLDQTRGWFYTLHVIATALFNKPAFKNVIVNGIVLAEDGNKMSKRLKNYPDPNRVLGQYGADAIRLFLLNSPAVQGDDLRFSEKGVEQLLRGMLIPYWNSVVFLSTYAKIYGWTPDGQENFQPAADIDRWLLSRLHELIGQVRSAMDDYTLNQASALFIQFVDELTNWYIRRCRSRFWADEDSQDRREAFSTLYTAVKTLTLIMAPFIPFLTEEVYQQLKTTSDPESVHLCDYPSVNLKLRDEILEMEMKATQLLVSQGHSLRKQHKVKVRQPLAKADVICADQERLKALQRQENLIKEELNVHEIHFTDKEQDVVELICKPNFPVLGKKVGSKMRAAQQVIGALSHEQMAILLNGDSLSIEIDQEPFTLMPEDVQVDRRVKEGLIARSEEGITLALDTTLNDQLIKEGMAREIINKLNTMRRDGGFAVTDRIEIIMETSETLERAFALHKDFILHEVLGVEVTFGPCDEGKEWDINGETASIGITLAKES